MSRKVVVGYRRGPNGEDALALTRVLAAARLVTEVVVVEVIDDDARREKAEDRLRPLLDGWLPDVSVTARAVSGDSVSDVLLASADEEDADALVLGATHRGRAGRMLLGTTAGHVFSVANRPVLVAPRGYRDSAGALERIGIAFDGSTESDRALDWAVDLASKAGARLRLVSVAEPPPPPAETWAGSVPADAWAEGLAVAEVNDVLDVVRARQQRDLETARAAIGLREVETATIVGDPVHELRGEAANLDLLVVGSHGRGRVDSALMGSVSRGLANSCPAPLAVVPSTRRGDGTPPQDQRGKAPRSATDRTPQDPT